MLTIRPERASDRDGIHQVHCLAFPTPAEANLVSRLRDEGAVCASIVAVVDDRIAGHALFSLAALQLESETLEIAALGPVGVLPEQQRRGIGDAMIRAGLERCQARGLPATIVLGHPSYYPRFGFERADTWSIRCTFDVPMEAFMIAWTTTPVNRPGLARYHPAFDKV